MPGHRIAWNAPSRLRGCAQANYQQPIPNLQFTHCIIMQHYTMVTMATMGGDLQPGCLADRLLTGLGQPQINP